MEQPIEKEQKKSSAIKAGFFYTVCNFIVKGAVFLTTPIFTRIMSSEDIGAFSNISSWLSILLILVTFDLAGSLNIARFDYKDDFDSYVATNLIFGTILSSVFFVIVLFNQEFFSNILSIDNLALNVLFVYLLVQPAMQMFQNINMFRFKYKLSSLISLASVFLSVGLSILFTFLFKNSLHGRVVGFFAPQIIISLALYVFLLTKIRKIRIGYIKYALLLCVPMLFHSVSIHILNAGDKIIITRFLGESQNAYYSIAATCCHIIAVLFSSMNSAWSPWSANMFDSGKHEIVRKNSRYYVLFFSTISFGLLLIGPDILYLMGGREYMQSLHVMPPLIIGIQFQFMYSLYVNAEFFLKKQFRIAVGTILCAAVNILLNVVFVPKYGIVAAGYTTLASYILLFVYHMLSLMIIGKKDWYDNVFNIITGAIFLLLLIPIYFLYLSNVARYIVIGIFVLCLAIFFLIKKKNIMSFIKSYFIKS